VAREKRIKIKEVEQPTSVRQTEEDYPLFCFKHLSPTSIKGCKESDFFYEFLMRLNKLSEMGWAKIRESRRHDYGLESLPKEQIKKRLPPFITPEVKKLHVFRACSDNRPFVGLQRDKVFHVLFIESKIGDIYDH
jgi:hypothetical protein